MPCACEPRRGLRVWENKVINWKVDISLLQQSYIFYIARKEQLEQTDFLDLIGKEKIDLAKKNSVPQQRIWVIVQTTCSPGCSDLVLWRREVLTVKPNRNEEGEIDHFILGKMDGCHAIDQLDDLLLRVFPCPLKDTRNNPILCKSFSTIVWSIACAEIGGD